MWRTIVSSIFLFPFVETGFYQLSECMTDGIRNHHQKFHEFMKVHSTSSIHRIQTVWLIEIDVSPKIPLDNNRHILYKKQILHANITQNSIFLFFMLFYFCFSCVHMSESMCSYAFACIHTGTCICIWKLGFTLGCFPLFFPPYFQLVSFTSIFVCKFL